MSTRTILFIAWGRRFVEDLQRLLAESRLPDYPIVLMTDLTTDTDGLPPGTTVVRHEFKLRGKERKTEAFAALPDGLGTVLFLDVDIRVIGDVSLGFDKAEQYGLAMAPAPHYSLGDFRTFSDFMVLEGVEPRGQMIYNSGVIFFDSTRRDVQDVFALALALSRKDAAGRWSDQPYITFALELTGLNPYTLSPSFNHRAFGELISGAIRIWHSPHPLPPGAGDPEPGWLHRYENGALAKVMRVPIT